MSDNRDEDDDTGITDATWTRIIGPGYGSYDPPSPEPGTPAYRDWLRIRAGELLDDEDEQ